MMRQSPFTLSTPERVVDPLALRPRDAARVLGISERLLWDWTRTEGVPHVRIGNVVLYPVEVLKNWLAAKATTAEDDPGECP
ncbi:hypothetical protein LBMAG47_14110 [Planctomycetia bacterium]|nr:hypothetical protein LBMAG47_14110 [Planctomycetia bacterium]